MVPSTRNSTGPEGVPAPGATGATVATSAADSTLTTTVVAALATVSCEVPSAVAYVVPLLGRNVAPTVRLPTASGARSTLVALPPLSSITAPTGAPSRLNWTVPVA